MSKVQQNRELKKRNGIFNYYANDLLSVLSQWKIKLSKRDGQKAFTYLCPITFNFFEKNSITTGELTLEHVPPDSLGGKGIILTAKEINNTHGAANDKRLLQYIETRYFLKSEGSLPIYLSSEKHDIKGLKLDLIMDSRKRSLNFFAPKRNIDVLERMGIFNDWDGLHMKFRGYIFQNPDKSAMLKIAYLLAFHKLGYQLILGPKQFENIAFKKIADYLASKSKFDIPIVGLRDAPIPISKGTIGIVVSPVNYQCLVVKFSIGIKGRSHYNYCIFLPHPFDENFDNLLMLKKSIDSKSKFNLQIESIDEHLENYIGELPVLWYHSLWQSIFDRNTP